MNQAAITHHAYDVFCYPLDKDNLRLTVRTGKDITKVTLIWGDPFKSEKIGDKWEWKCEHLVLSDLRETQSHFFWSATIVPPFKRVRYYFEVSDGKESKYFFEDGFFPVDKKSPEEHVHFIFPWMNEADISVVPDWAPKTVWYQIFPARFAHGENPCDKHTLLPWAGPDKKVRNEERYGGNLRGITDHIPYLHNLGINGIYLNPVNISDSQHKYDTIDYLKIDPEFGTEEDMTLLVKTAHDHGMKVMLDGVFNHSGWNFFAWLDVVKNRENSRYKDWYIINDFDFADHPTNAAEKGKFYSFALTDYMPKLNTNNPEVRKYIIDVCTAWVKNYDIDALRLDVANEISHKLCKELRDAMRKLKPDFFIVGEIWNHAMPWLRGDEFDSAINYPLRTAITDFAENESLGAHYLEEQLNYCFMMYYEQNERVMVNQLDSHDTLRLVTKVNGDREKALQEFALLFVLPGSTCIYYGTEVLLEGEHDPDCRRCMPWKEIDEGRYEKELSVFKTLISLRKEYPALQSMNVSFDYDSVHNKESRLVFIRRKGNEGDDQLIFVANFTDKTFSLPDEMKNRECLSSNLLCDGIMQPKGFAIFCA